MTGCDNLIRIAPPRTQIDADVVFTTNETANAAVIRLYGDFSTVNMGFRSTAIGNLSSDEFQSVAAALQAVHTNSITAEDNVILTNVWYPYYQTIHRANAIIQGLSENSGVDEHRKKELSGEAKAIRAYCYFYLVNFFGKIPLLTTTDLQTNLRAKRAEIADVWQLIETDIAEAINDLPIAYQSAERARMNRSAAFAFQARIKLYLGKWSEAEAAATELIDNTSYELETDLAAVFLTSSRETIWQGWIENGFTSFASNMVPTSATAAPAYTLSPSLLAMFENTDLRQQKWTGFNIIAGNRLYYPAKYKRRAATSNLPSEYMIILRLAEQFLIRAEARARQENKLAQAIADLDAVRQRAGLIPIADSERSPSQADLLAAIEQERLRELFTEGSHRWFDLKRTGQLDAIMSAAKGASWRATAALYPIPQQERLNNNNLSQNEGYE